MTKEIKLLVGVPGSGKSTWAKDEVNRLYQNGIICNWISRDIIRFEMVPENEDYFSKEREVFNEFVREINNCIKAGIEIIFVDATHISAASRRKILSKIDSNNNIILSCEIFTITEELAAARNSQRTGRAQVPPHVIPNMIRDFEIPSFKEFKKQNNYGFKAVHFNYHPQKAGD